MKAYELLYLVKKIAQTKCKVKMEIGFARDGSNDGYYADITDMPHSVIESLGLNDYLLTLENGSIRITQCSGIVKDKVMHRIDELDREKE